MVDTASRRKLLSFRRCLLSFSDTLNEDELDCLKFLYKSRMPRNRFLKMTEGYQLFAFLEQKGIVSPDKYRDVLRSLLSVLGKDIERGLSECESASRSCPPINLGISVDIPGAESMIPVPASVQTLYDQCMSEIGDSLAREDGSLQRLVYVSGCIPLKCIETLQNGRAFVLELEKVGAISCWNLHGLDSLFRTAKRQDLAHKLQSYTRLASVAMPTNLNSNASCKLSCVCHSSASAFVRSISEPSRLQPTYLSSHFHNFTPAGTAVSSFPAAVAPPNAPNGCTSKDVIDGGTVSDAAKLAIFEHPVYVYLQRLFAFPGVYHVFVSMFLLTCIFSVGKLKLEWNHCGPGTAILNFVAKLLTHNVLPFYILSTLPGIVSDLKLRNCAFLTKTLNQEIQDVMLGVVRKLSTPEEWKDLCGLDMLPAQKVTFLLQKKLTCIAMTSLAQSATFSFGICLIIVANWSVFTGFSVDTFARVNCFVLVFTSLVIHGTVTLAVSIFLFEMRVCEYLSHMTSVALKKKAYSVSAIAKKMKKVLETRWAGFSNAIAGFTLAYVVILGLSAYLRVPFRCGGGKKLDLSPDELIDVPSCWLCWVLVGFLCQLLVCWYRVFVHGRIVAVIMQLLFAVILMHQHTSGQHLKWAGLLQIIHALYPVAYGLSVFHVRCCHIWTESALMRSRSSHSSRVCKMPFSKLASFVANFCAFSLIVLLSAYAVSVEYDSFQSLL